MTLLSKELAAQQKRLRAAADPAPIERLRAEHARLRTQFEASAETSRATPAGSEETSALGRRVSALDAQIRAAQEARADAVGRLRNIDRWLGAAARVEAARARVEKGRAALDTAEQRLATVDEGIARLGAQRAKAAAVAAVEIEVLARRALSDAGLDGTGAADGAGRVSSAAATGSSPQVVAIDAATQRAQAERQAADAEVNAVRAKLHDAEQEQREAQADAAELHHLENLVGMLTTVLPALRAWRAANDAAGRVSRMPDFEVLLADEGDADPTKRLLELWQ